MSLRGWFVDRVTVAPFESEGDEGEDNFGTQVKVRGRLERFVGSIRSTDGEERTVEWRFATDIGKIGPRDRVWLPEDDETLEDDSRVPVDIREARRKGGRGGHAEVFFG